MLNVIQHGRSQVRDAHPFLVICCLVAVWVQLALCSVSLRSPIMAGTGTANLPAEHSMEAGLAAMSGLESSYHLKHELVRRFGLSGD